MPALRQHTNRGTAMPPYLCYLYTCVGIHPGRFEPESPMELTTSRTEALQTQRSSANSLEPRFHQVCPRVVCLPSPRWLQNPVGHGLNCLPPGQHVEMVHGEEISQLFNGRDSVLHRSWRLSICSSRFLRQGMLSQFIAWLPEWWQSNASSCSVQQSLNVFQLVMTQFLGPFHFFLKKTDYTSLNHINGAQTANGIFQTSNTSLY